MGRPVAAWFETRDAPFHVIRHLFSLVVRDAGGRGDSLCVFCRTRRIPGSHQCKDAAGHPGTQLLLSAALCSLAGQSRLLATWATLSGFDFESFVVALTRFSAVSRRLRTKVVGTRSGLPPRRRLAPPYDPAQATPRMLRDRDGVSLSRSYVFSESAGSVVSHRLRESLSIGPRWGPGDRADAPAPVRGITSTRRASPF